MSENDEKLDSKKKGWRKSRNRKGGGEQKKSIRSIAYTCLVRPHLFWPSLSVCRVVLYPQRAIKKVAFIFGTWFPLNVTLKKKRQKYRNKSIKIESLLWYPVSVLLSFLSFLSQPFFKLLYQMLRVFISPSRRSLLEILSYEMRVTTINVGLHFWGVGGAGGGWKTSLFSRLDFLIV